VTSPVAAVADAVRERPPRLGRTRLVCVDGPAGSGKTTFAEALAAGVDAQVVHMDDLYAGWTLTGARARLAAAVLRPLACGEPGSYRAYDWAGRRFADEPTPVAVGGVLVVEGCGSCAPQFDQWTTLRIWVEAPPPLRLARGLARDGTALEPEWRHWQELEDAVFTAESTWDRADVRIDGSRPLD
jgi:uridine kinase